MCLSSCKQVKAPRTKRKREKVENEVTEVARPDHVSLGRNFRFHSKCDRKLMKSLDWERGIMFCVLKG